MPKINMQNLTNLTKDAASEKLLELRDLLRNDFKKAFDTKTNDKINFLTKTYKLKSYWNKICSE
jgi:hypothetical protein